MFPFNKYSTALSGLFHAAFKALTTWSLGNPIDMSSVTTASFGWFSAFGYDFCSGFDYGFDSAFFYYWMGSGLTYQALGASYFFYYFFCGSGFLNQGVRYFDGGHNDEEIAFLDAELIEFIGVGGGLALEDNFL